MSKPLVLTCDIGTQSARALLVDPDGRIVDVVQSKYAEPYFSKEPGWAEQKPNFYFDRLCECCRELCARSNALLPDVIAMTITVIRDTVVCLDANNEPLRDIILWLDKRTVDPNGAMPAKNMMLFKVARHGANGEGGLRRLRRQLDHAPRAGDLGQDRQIRHAAHVPELQAHGQPHRLGLEPDRPHPVRLQKPPLDEARQPHALLLRRAERKAVRPCALRHGHRHGHGRSLRPDRASPPACR